jgi:hypothetical protein
MDRETTMIESLLVTLVAGSTAQVSKLLIEEFKKYLRKKGEKVSESATEVEISKSLASLEERESSTVAVVEAQNVFGNAISQLAGFRIERERQAKNSYNLACGVLATGSLLVLVGIGWMMLSNSVSPGMVTSAVGAITSPCSGAIFKFSKDANDRLDDIAANLHKIEATRMALEVVQRISDEDERNEAIKQIGANLAQMDKDDAPRKRAANKTR